MKTYLDYFKELKEPARSQAIVNCKSQKEALLENTTSSLIDALQNGFIWINTPEGGNYWLDIEDNIEQYIDKKETRTFESGSVRDADETKPLVNHFDAYCRLRFGYLLRKGANHYGKSNWKLGQPDEVAIESLNRHLALYEIGDRTEDHLSAIIFNAQLLMKNEEKEGIKFDHYFK